MGQFNTIQTQALSTRIRTATASGAVNLTDYTILGNASAGSITLTLPTAASAFNASLGVGQVFSFKKIDATVNTVVIDGNGVETIDGSPTVVLSVQYESRTIQSNGASWFIL